MTHVNDHNAPAPEEGEELSAAEKAELDRRLALELEGFEGGIQG